MPRSKVLSPDIIKCVNSVFEYFQHESERGYPRFAVFRVYDRVAAALKISKSSISRIINKDSKKSHKKGDVHRKPRRYDDFDLCIVRRRMHQFYRDGELPTVARLQTSLANQHDLDISRPTLCRMLWKTGFKYKSTATISKIIYEDNSMASRRIDYLRNIKKAREDNT